MDYFLNHVEELSTGTVYASVLHKTYRELMLLGFISFAIFFLNTDKNISTTFVASFNYADFVIFYLGMGFICQNIMTCLANYLLKIGIFKFCYMDTKELVAQHLRVSNGYFFPSFTTSYLATRMQLFRNIFLIVYDLPDEFSFPHYFGSSLDALTGDLTELLPSSYLYLAIIILVSEYVVRHYPLNWQTLRHPVSAKTIPDTYTVFFYGVIGFIIFLLYIYLFVICSTASNAVIKDRFPNQVCPFLAVVAARLLYFTVFFNFVSYSYD